MNENQILPEDNPTAATAPPVELRSAEVEAETTTISASNNLTATTPASDPDFDALESLMRLIVGGSIEIPVELVERLKKWEAIVAAEEQTSAAETEPSSSDKVVFATVGMLFEAQEQLRDGLTLFGRFAHSSSRSFLQAAQPVTGSSVMRPFTRRFEKLVSRGERSVDRWLVRGQAETPHSRSIAREALVETIDEFIDQLAENPQLRSLITQQSVGFAGEIVDGVRSRTVSADTLLERLARGLLKRPPREQLPPPAPEIIAQAEELTIFNQADKEEA